MLASAAVAATPPHEERTRVHQCCNAAFLNLRSSVGSKSTASRRDSRESARFLHLHDEWLCSPLPAKNTSSNPDLFRRPKSGHDRLMGIAVLTRAPAAAAAETTMCRHSLEDRRSHR